MVLTANQILVYKSGILWSSLSRRAVVADAVVGQCVYVHSKCRLRITTSGMDANIAEKCLCLK